MGGGLTKVLKMFGEMNMSDSNGKKVTWVYDYAKDKAVLKSEITKEDFVDSEIAKWKLIKKAL